MAFKGRYFIVRDGPFRDDFSNVRVTTSRVFSGVDACNQTFGKVTESMFVKDVGVRTLKYMSMQKRLELITSTDGWLSMKGVESNGSGDKNDRIY